MDCFLVSCKFSSIFRLFFIIICFLSPAALAAPAAKCQPQSFHQSSFVCVCSDKHCDSVEKLGDLGAKYAVYTTSKTGDRLEKRLYTFATTSNISADNPGATFTINQNLTYQTILGFGGAFTDAAGINVLKLPKAAQDNLLKSYFSPDGLEYNIGRIPMASCDFSTRTYTYDDFPGDYGLDKFALAKEDITYKIPIVQRAMEMKSGDKIKLFGSPWSAPAWLKTNNNLTGNGSLIGQPGNKYHKTWALYFVKFLQEYAKHNISFWGLTAQNEPADGGVAHFRFQCMYFNSSTQRDFLKLDLIPALHANGYQDVKVMILDDSRIWLPAWAETVLGDKELAANVSGIAVHWYLDNYIPANVLDFTHQKFPQHFILATEACEGAVPWEVVKVSLGNWQRGEAYSHDIIQDLQHWVQGWTDWNLALDMEGGPNWVKNFVDSPIIVDADKKVFYKQPMFYHLGHFSKFLPENSVRLGVQASGAGSTDLEVVAFSTPNKQNVFIALNRNPFAVNVSITGSDKGYINAQVPESSIQTYIWDA